ncbi:putative Histidine kinase [Gammaproteobacteria bacterium]
MLIHLPAPLRRISPRWPLVMAVAFGLYSAALLTYSISAWRQIKEDANNFLVADSKRRAVTLGDLALELRDNALGYTNLPEMYTYLTNRDLGMSPRYGLNYSIQMIKERFTSRAVQDAQRWGTNPPRIIYFLETGAPLVDTGPPDAPFDFVASLDEQVKLLIDPAHGWVLAVAQVDFKERREGRVVVATPIEVLYRNLLLRSESATGYRELLLTNDSTVLPTRVPNTMQSEWLTQLLPNSVTPVDAEGELFAIMTPVPGLALRLMTLVPHERAYGHIVSASVLWVAAVVPLLMLFVAFRLDRLRMQTERLQVAMAASERERLRAEIRNYELAEEIQRRETLEAHLKERTEQLEAIFTLSSDGFVTFGPTHRASYISPGFWKITGLADAISVGLTFDDFIERIAAHCATGSLEPLRGGHGSGQTRIELRQPGSPVLTVAVRFGAGDVVAEILYFRDITHETAVERIKNEFLAMAAHELRTPMASIYGFTEVLLSQDLSAEIRELLEIIFHSSELVITIINELLDLARIEARQGKDFHLERIDARALVDEIVIHFKVPAGSTSPLKSVMELDHYWIRADHKKLIQALGNVLSNAYKYSPHGGAVTIELLATPPRVGICITDQGIGMTPQQLNRIYERFYRADTSGKIPGAGLGMSIVKEIIELHGGVIEIVSELGIGTRVTLWLPMANTEV